MQPQKCDCFNGFCFRQFCIDKADKWAKKKEVENEKKPIERVRGKRRPRANIKANESDTT